LAFFAAVFNAWQLVGMAIVCLVFFVELVINWTKEKKVEATATTADGFQREVETTAINQ